VICRIIFSRIRGLLILPFLARQGRCALGQASVDIGSARWAPPGAAASSCGRRAPCVHKHRRAQLPAMCWPREDRVRPAHGLREPRVSGDWRARGAAGPARGTPAIQVELLPTGRCPPARMAGLRLESAARRALRHPFAYPPSGLTRTGCDPFRIFV
jgi:hypothetical protein